MALIVAGDPSQGSAEADFQAYPPTPKMNGYFNPDFGQSSTGGDGQTDRSGTVDRIRQAPTGAVTESVPTSGTEVGAPAPRRKSLRWDKTEPPLSQPYRSDAHARACLDIGHYDMQAVLAEGDLQRIREVKAAGLPYCREIAGARKRLERRLFPAVYGSERVAAKHLYVFEILEVGTKVGIAADPDQRIATHRQWAQMYRRDFGRMWFSISHLEARFNECSLLHWAESGQREVLDRSFDDVVRYAQLMRMTPSAPQAHYTDRPGGAR